MQREKTQHISAFIKAFIRENHLEEGLLRCRVLDALDQVIEGMSTGPAPHASAGRIISSRSFRDGTLTCRMNSSVLRMQFRMNSDSIRKKINDRLGGTVVTKIIFQ